MDLFILLWSREEALPCPEDGFPAARLVDAARIRALVSIALCIHFPSRREWSIDDAPGALRERASSLSAGCLMRTVIAVRAGSGGARSSSLRAGPGLGAVASGGSKEEEGEAHGTSSLS